MASKKRSEQAQRSIDVERKAETIAPAVSEPEAKEPRNLTRESIAIKRGEAAAAQIVK